MKRDKDNKQTLDELERVLKHTVKNYSEKARTQLFNFDEDRRAKKSKKKDQ